MLYTLKDPLSFWTKAEKQDSFSKYLPPAIIGLNCFSLNKVVKSFNHCVYRANDESTAVNSADPDDGFTLTNNKAYNDATSNSPRDVNDTTLMTLNRAYRPRNEGASCKDECSVYFDRVYCENSEFGGNGSIRTDIPYYSYVSHTAT